MVCLEVKCKVNRNDSQTAHGKFHAYTQNVDDKDHIYQYALENVSEADGGTSFSYKLFDEIIPNVAV